MSELTKSSEEPAFTSYNSAGTRTLIFLHALYSSPLEFAHVPQYIPADYHIIVPHLPQHSESVHIQPFSLALAADKTADLIRKHSATGTAHITGVSLGGFTALELVRRHPDVVESVFTTGCTPFGPWQLRLTNYPSLMSWGFYLTIQSGLYKAAAALSELLPHRPLVVEMMKNNTYDLSKHACKEMREWREEQTRDVGRQDKRILVCAGGHGDDVAATREFAKTLAGLGVGEGKETRAAVVKDAIHGWDLQFPKLFAEGVVAWAEKRPLPEKFEAAE